MEILMMKEGYEVCCLSKEDETRQALAAGDGR